MSFSPEISKLISSLRDLNGDVLRLPLPRRAELEPVLAYRKLFLGSEWGLIESYCKKEKSTVEMMNILENTPGLMEKFKGMGIDQGTMNSNLFILRHLAMKAPIMTVSEGLAQMLLDTNIKDDVPARFFAPPFRTVYIEFNEADKRHLANHYVAASGALSACEGCYVQESYFEKPMRMSREAMDAIDIDPNKPLRIVEIGFTASPYNDQRTMKDTSGIPVVSDQVDFATIYIQDEDEPIKEILEKHFNHFRNTVMKSNFLSEKNSHQFEKLFTENFSFLSKVLFYLHLEKNERVSVRDASELEERIKSIGLKKQNKLKRQLQRKYDHIIIGPLQYTPISARIARGAVPSRTKAPHYRRGSFAIRWKGTGQAKIPVMTRIKESIVNEHLLTDDPVKKKRDYVIK